MGLEIGQNFTNKLLPHFKGNDATQISDPCEELVSSDQIDSGEKSLNASGNMSFNEPKLHNSNGLSTGKILYGIGTVAATAIASYALIKNRKFSKEITKLTDELSNSKTAREDLNKTLDGLKDELKTTNEKLKNVEQKAGKTKTYHHHHYHTDNGVGNTNGTTTNTAGSGTGNTGSTTSTNSGTKRKKKTKKKSFFENLKGWFKGFGGKSKGTKSNNTASNTSGTTKGGRSKKTKKKSFFENVKGWFKGFGGKSKGTKSNNTTSNAGGTTNAGGGNKTKKKSFFENVKGWFKGLGGKSKGTKSNNTA